MHSVLEDNLPLFAVTDPQCHQTIVEEKTTVLTSLPEYRALEVSILMMANMMDYMDFKRSETELTHLLGLSMCLHIHRHLRYATKSMHIQTILA